jgi:hypothetical protein
MVKAPHETTKEVVLITEFRGLMSCTTVNIISSYWPAAQLLWTPIQGAVRCDKLTIAMVGQQGRDAVPNRHRLLVV